MTTIVTRAVKGLPLTWVEGDANFNNLNTDKIEEDDVRTLTNKTLAAATNVIEARSGPGASAFSHRNKIINGAFQVWQRGTSITTTSGAYTADRFLVEIRNSTSTTVAQSTDVPTGSGFGFSARLSATAGTDDGFHLRFSVELPATGNYGEFVAGSTWTLSYWAKSAYSGRSFTPYLILSDTVNALTNSSTAVPIGSAASLTTSWQKFTHTVTLPAWVVDSGSLSSVKALLVRMIHGADNTPQDTYITGVQLEAGSVATPFEHRPYGVELALCQRYYEKSPTNNQYIAAGGATSTTVGVATFTGYKVPKRATPTTVSIYDNVDAAGKLFWSFASGAGSYTSAIDRSNAFGFGVQTLVGSGFTTGYGGTILGGYASEAEL